MKSTRKMERKTVEKNRRIEMKALCMKLSSLIPKHHPSTPKDMLTQQDHLEQATSYIINLQQRIDKLKEKKSMEMFELPVVEIRHKDCSMEVVLISGLNNRFKFHEVISVLEEEGAQVVNASFSVVADKIFYTIHSQAISSRIGLEASRISERLKDLVR